MNALIWRQLRVLLIPMVMLLSMVPVAHAVSCSPQIISVDYPVTLDLGQSFQVATYMNVTCSIAKVFITARIDVVESASGVILSSTSVPIGYFPDLGGGTVNATAVNDVVAPPIAANWTLQVRGIFWASTIGVGGVSGSPFTIMVGHAAGAPERLESYSILTNGGFEEGFDGWKAVKNWGFLSITGKVTHNGTSALRLEMPEVPFPSGSVPGAMYSGLSQSISVQNLRSLRVRLWVLDGCYVPDFDGCSLAGNGRLRVQIGRFVETYGFTDCSSWCMLDHNVTEDLRPRLTLGDYASITHSTQAVTVKISLELLNGGAHFVAFIDDVQVDASVPLGTVPSASQLTHSGDEQETGGNLSLPGWPSGFSQFFIIGVREVIGIVGLPHPQTSPT